MPTAYKVLGQVNPSATTETTLYTCPSATQTVVSTLSVCNLSASAATFRIAIRPDGASIANEHYVVYDATLNANDSITFTLGITINASDITVRASNTSFAFQAFGSEIA